MSVILGINAFHADSAACLVVDGQLRAAVAEERLGDRQKHSPQFPQHAIRSVLKQAGLQLRDVTHVAIARNPKANVLSKARYVLSKPTRSMAAVWEHFNRNRKTQDTFDQLAEICGEPRSHAKFQIVPVEHHLAHIASAYYLSPFESLTAGFSYDASGDFVSAMAARCEGNKIEILDRVALPHSLGFFYTALCQFIGFDEFGEEYKVMGLAPYGKDAYPELMKKLVTLPDDGWFQLARGYFGMHQGGQSGALDSRSHIIMGRLFTEKLSRELGEPRQRSAPLTDRERNIARSCQVRFEEAAVHCLSRLHQLVPTTQLVMAGGCALNGVANARILRDTPFRTPYLQSASSDDGTCLGAAYWCYHNVAGGTQRFHMQHAFWGPGYSDADNLAAAKMCDIHFQRLEGDALLDAVTDLLRQGKVVGWFQGRSEWGPRALGNRTILADPTNPKMKEIINAKIKRRESFRPFAPSVLAESAPKYFEQTVASPFMMHVVKFKPEWQAKLPAVCHVDGTGRLQTVSRHENELYYDLIKNFGRKSGADIVLNTSFNENEPVVDTPQQALNCFLRTDMDALCLGNYLLQKPTGA
ncbi:MAG: carbamoyltransferase [Verrucomicrobia bacterium]|nr:MAG: carbamoyltransferase [Verrucomicrobiota bacterium]